MTDRMDLAGRAHDDARAGLDRLGQWLAFSAQMSGSLVLPYIWIGDETSAVRCAREAWRVGEQALRRREPEGSERT